ncbi:MAG TPA: pantothenate kinase [Rikenellaceae bacterium]|nr:pantothenate kinase [Rikenellaceae bacterium]
MPNLLVEIGNTALKAAWSEGVTLGKTFRYQGEKMFDYVDSLVEKEKPAVMVISSTIEIGSDEEEKLRSKCGTLVVLDEKHTDVACEYDLPAYLSPDRVASVIAARHLFKGKGSMVFDFGTTLTIDVIEPDGEYAGGNISPGFRTRFKSLSRYSRTLPLLDTPLSVRQTGNSLKSSIESGVVSGIMFEITGYLSLFPEKIVVFTGGDALYFAKRMKNSIFAVCNLVLMGLALIADKYYVEKNG